MKTMISPSAAEISDRTALSRSSNSPRNFGARHHGAEIERHELLALERFRHVVVDDAQRQALGDRGLADAGLADQHGIVLGAAAQYLDRAADLLVAADHRIELAVFGRLGEVAGVFLQGIVALLGRRRIGGAPLAQVLDGFFERLSLHARLGERLGSIGAGRHVERLQQPLDRDEGIAGLLGDLLRLLENPRGLGRKVDLASTATLDLRLLGQRRLDFTVRNARVTA